MSLWVAIFCVCSAIICAYGAVWVYFTAYDIRFRLDSAERSIQALHSKVGKELNKAHEEVAQQVESYLHDREQTSSSGSTDIGEAILMQMLAGSMQQPTQPDETGDNLDAIHDLMLGSGGDTERRGGNNTGPETPTE